MSRCAASGRSWRNTTPAKARSFQLRLRFERNTYRPYVEPHTHIPQVVESPPADHLRPPTASGPASRSAPASLAVVAIAALLLWRPTASANRAPRVLAESPIWAGFRSSNVVVAIGTPLFFRSAAGFERNFGANLPEDLGAADNCCCTGPRIPSGTLGAVRRCRRRGQPRPFPAQPEFHRERSHPPGRSPSAGWRQTHHRDRTAALRSAAARPSRRAEFPSAPACRRKTFRRVYQRAAQTGRAGQSIPAGQPL